jgi:hypothetical protein
MAVVKRALRRLCVSALPGGARRKGLVAVARAARSRPVGTDRAPGATRARFGQALVDGAIAGRGARRKAEAIAGTALADAVWLLLLATSSCADVLWMSL